MRVDILPPRFPSDLSQAAFLSESDVAWPIHSCAAVIEWLRGHGFAVLGTELWLVINGDVWAALPRRNGSEIYGNSCEHKPEESWTDYVDRAAKEATDAIVAFQWPEDATHGKPSDVHFNITWADKAWFGYTGQ